jgi:hypothetical protein
MSRKLILCLPGNEFDSQIVVQLVKFMNWCQANDWEIILSVKGGSNVSLVREFTLGMKEKDWGISEYRAPFYGKTLYDYILCVDSDICFTIEDFQRLVDDDKDIVAGAYKKNEKYFTSSHKVDEEGNFESHTEDDLRGTEPFEVICFGLGFVLIKKGVFEKILRPWFLTTVYNYKGSNMKEVGEDIYFCLKAQDSGFKTWLDPRVRLVHVKKIGLQ